MRYTYAYKSSDGVRHEAAMEAASRDAVFAALRKQGIRPIKVVAADGAKANGEIRGVRKRVAAGIALGAAVVAGVAAFLAGEREGGGRGATALPDVAPRHQIYGDPVLIDEFERGRFDAAFTNRLDQMLAWFAQPGKFMCPRGTDPRRMGDVFVDAMSSSRQNEEGGSASDAERTPHPQDPREVRELKEIVNGLREEMAAYLANGNGTPRSYWRRLVERTVQEAQIYERTRRELEKEKDPFVFEQKNEALRRLGIRTIPNPTDGE